MSKVSPPLHTEGSWHPEVTGGIAVALVNAAWEQFILSLRGGVGELLLTAAPTSLLAQGSFLCTWAETGQQKTKGVFLVEKIAFYREWTHAVKFQQIYSGMHVPGIIRRVNRKTIYSSTCVFK